MVEGRGGMEGRGGEAGVETTSMLEADDERGTEGAVCDDVLGDGVGRESAMTGVGRNGAPDGRDPAMMGGEGRRGGGEGAERGGGAARPKRTALTVDERGRVSGSDERLESAGACKSLGSVGMVRLLGNFDVQLQGESQVLGQLG